MIQITKFLNPDKMMWHENKHISVLEWMEIESKVIKRKTNKDTKIVTLDRRIALFRERIK